MDPIRAPITPLASGFSSDLTDFVVSPIVINDSMGNPATTFYYGSNYNFLINFAETAALQFEYYHDTATGTDYMTYQLPPQLKVPQTIVDHSPYPIFGESATPGGPLPVIGSYSININGLIKVHFDNVDIYGNQATVFDEILQQYVPVNFIDYYSDAAFTLNINAQFQQAGAGQLINFGNNVTVTITVENPLSGNLTIAKTAVVDPIVNQTVTFTVTITAINNPVHDITLNDFEQPNMSGWLQKALFSSMTATVAGGAPYTPPEFTALQGQLFGAGFSLAFTSVILNPGEQIVVVFTLDVADLISQWAAANSGTAGEYNFDIWLYNRAVAQGTDESGNPTQMVSANYNAHLVRQFFKKAGAQDLSADYTAKWSNWSVGDGVTLLNSSTVTDTLTGLLFGANNPMPNNTNGAYVTFLDPTGTPIASWYIPVAAGATGFSLIVPAANEIVVTGLRGDGVYVQGRGIHATDNTLPYGSILTVTVQPFWTTVANTADFDTSVANTYQNTITVDINGDQPSYTANAVIRSPGATPTITKTAAFGGDDGSGGPDYVQWTITYYIPGASYNQPVYVTDSSFIYVYGFGGDAPNTSRRFNLINVPDNLVVTVYSTALGERTLIRNTDFTLLDPVNNNGYTPTQMYSVSFWYLFFIADTTGIPWNNLGPGSLWPFQDDTWLTITFNSPLDTVIQDAAGNTMTLKEALQWSQGSTFSDLMNWVYGYNPISQLMTPATPYVSTSTDIRWALRKTATVSGNIITYLIEIRREDFTFADVYTDVFDPNLEYVPFSLRIWKNDATATYYGPYQMVGGVFTDMLSQSITGNAMSFDFLSMYHVSWGPDGAVYYPNPTLLSDSTPAAVSYFIEYKMKLSPNAPLGQITATNTASINGFTNSSSEDIGNPIVAKTMTAASNIATAAITINPDALTLAGSAGMYTVTDTLTDTLALYLSTLVVQAWESGAWVTHPLTNSTSGALWTYTTNGSNQFSIVVPDSTMLQITYEALIKGAVGDTVDIGNQVTAAGQYSDSTNENFNIADTSGSASGTRTVLSVIKSDAEQPNLLLSGAIFALYIGLQYPGWDTVTVPGGISRTITVGTTVFYYLGNGTTDANGRFVFDNAWLTPTHGAIYALDELQPPVGYAEPADPITLFAYTVPTPAQLAALGGKAVQQVADTVLAPDTALPLVSAIINGFKTVVGANPPETVFTFRLTQVADASGTPLPSPYTASTTTIGQGSFGFSLANLVDGNTYYYLITEDVDPTDPNWIYDPNAQTGQIVTVDVGLDGTVTVTYPSGASQVGFTNTLATGETADLAVTKTADQNAVQPGGLLTYTVTTINNGPDDAQNVTVTDAIPGALTGAEFSLDGIDWQPWTGSYAIGTLLNDHSFTLLLRGTVSATASGSITNTATVSSTTPDPDLTNNSATNVTPVTPATLAADLAVTKTADQSAVQPGDTLTYTVTTINNGPDDAQNVTVTDAIPSALTGAMFSTNNGVTWLPWTGSYVYGTLANGAAFALLIRGTVSATASGSISNTATVSSSTPDPDLTNNSATTVTTVTPAVLSADLAVVKKADQASVHPGGMLTYTITTTNHGPDDAQNVTVTDAVPPQLSSIGFSTNNGATWLPWTGSYNLGTLANGASFTILVRGIASVAAGANITNTATVNSTTPDPDLTNNSSTSTTPVNNAADLAVVKTACPHSAAPCRRITYTIVVANFGPNEAVNVMLTDTLPSELCQVQYSLDGQHWCQRCPWNDTLLLGNLPANSSTTLLVRGTVRRNATGSISNTVTVSSRTPDPNPNNNQFTLSTPIRTCRR